MKTSKKLLFALLTSITAANTFDCVEAMKRKEPSDGQEESAAKRPTIDDQTQAAAARLFANPDLFTETIFPYLEPAEQVIAADALGFRVNVTPPALFGDATPTMVAKIVSHLNADSPKEVLNALVLVKALLKTDCAKRAFYMRAATLRPQLIAQFLKCAFRQWQDAKLLCAIIETIGNSTLDASITEELGLILKDAVEKGVDWLVTRIISNENITKQLSSLNLSWALNKAAARQDLACFNWLFARTIAYITPFHIARLIETAAENDDLEIVKLIIEAVGNHVATRDFDRIFDNAAPQVKPFLYAYISARNTAESTKK